jgi:hypothetical protein
MPTWPATSSPWRRGCRPTRRCAGGCRPSTATGWSATPTPTPRRPSAGRRRCWTPSSTTSPSGGPSRPARGSVARSSSSPRRASTTSTATASASCAWSRPRPAATAASAPSAASPRPSGSCTGSRPWPTAPPAPGPPAWPGSGTSSSSPNWSARCSASARAARRSPPWSPAWSTSSARSSTSSSGSRWTRSSRPPHRWSPRPSPASVVAPSFAKPATTANTAPYGSSPPPSSATMTRRRGCSTPRRNPTPRPP